MKPSTSGLSKQVRCAFFTILALLAVGVWGACSVTDLRYLQNGSSSGDAAAHMTDVGGGTTNTADTGTGGSTVDASVDQGAGGSQSPDAGVSTGGASAAGGTTGRSGGNASGGNSGSGGTRTEADAAVARDAESRDDLPPSDGPGKSDAPVTPGTCQTGPGACVGSLPAGWKVVAFEKSRNSTCPAGFTTVDVVANPLAAAGACGCACAATSTPTCNATQILTFYSTDSSCGKTGVTLDVSGSCGQFSGSYSAYFSANAPTVAVTCTASATTDTTKLSSTKERICEAPTQCQEDVCGGVAPAGFSACIFNDADTACPTGWPNRTVVGSSTTVSCAACTGCTGSATCTGGKLTFFSDNACANSLATFNVDGSCQATGGSESVKSYAYKSATATNVQCKGSGPQTASVGLTGARTVCCK
jgi:hypothetical protein